MKKYLIFLLFFSLLSYSQDCKIKVEKDAFNKTIKSKIIQNNLSAGLSCDFYKLEKSDEKIYYLSFFLNNITSQCLTDKSKVYFLFEEDEVLEFPYRGKIDCGGTSIIIRLDEEQINLLLNSKIKQIRILIESNKDYSISEKKDLLFKENISCLLNNINNPK